MIGKWENILIPMEPGVFVRLVIYWQEMVGGEEMQR